eukprot:1761106-Prymnesium_polylepis.2
MRASVGARVAVRVRQCMCVDAHSKPSVCRGRSCARAARRSAACSSSLCAHPTTRRLTWLDA